MPDSPKTPSLGVRVKTERLVLRAPRASDVPELRLLLRRNADHLRPFSPLPRPGEDPSSLTGLSSLVVRQRSEWRSDRGYAFLVTMRTPDRPIVGRMNLNNVVRGAFQNAYVGYWVDEALQSKGIATEALRALTRFALSDLGLHRVQAAIMPHNSRSLAVVRKLGFREEGLARAYLSIAGKWEDHAIFAMTAEDVPRL